MTYQALLTMMWHKMMFINIRNPINLPDFTSSNQATHYAPRFCKLEAAMEFKTHELLATMAPVEVAKASASFRLWLKIEFFLLGSHLPCNSRL